MGKQSPKKNMELLQMTADALRELAPNTAFGGLKLADFEPFVNTCEQDRANLVDNENEGKALIVTRDTNDDIALAKRELIINGIIGDPNFGPNSPLYEACGYVRKSERKSGLTRKKKKVEPSK